MVVQVLLVMAILSYSSVYMLLCLITVAPILIGFSRLADVISSKGWTRHIPAQLQLPLAAACTGLGKLLGTVAAVYSGKCAG